MFQTTKQTHISCQIVGIVLPGGKKNVSKPWLTQSHHFRTCFKMFQLRRSLIFINSPNFGAGPWTYSDLLWSNSAGAIRLDTASPWKLRWVEGQHLSLNKAQQHRLFHCHLQTRPLGKPGLSWDWPTTTGSKELDSCAKCDGFWDYPTDRSSLHLSETPAPFRTACLLEEFPSHSSVEPTFALFSHHISHPGSHTALRESKTGQHQCC